MRPFFSIMNYIFRIAVLHVFYRNDIMANLLASSLMHHFKCKRTKNKSGIYVIGNFNYTRISPQSLYSVRFYISLPFPGR